MKNRSENLLWGLIFIIAGLVIGINVLFETDINLFFNGWWTLILIIPSIKNVLAKEAGFPSYLTLGIGMVLLLQAQEFLNKVAIPTLIFGIIFFSIGFSTLNKKNRKSVKKNEYQREYNTEGNREDYNLYEEDDNEHNYFYEESQKEENYHDLNNERFDDKLDQEPYGDNVFWSKGQYEHGNSYQSIANDHVNAILSSNQRQYIGEKYKGCNVISILGNVQIDIRNAVIEEDMFLNITCILGGIDMYIPSNIRIINQSTAILAEVESKVKEPNDLSSQFYTLYIRGICILGGIEIK